MSSNKHTRARKARGPKKTDSAPALTPEVIKRIRRIIANPPKTLAPYGWIAEQFDVPLWLLFVPDLHNRLDLRNPSRARVELVRLKSMVDNYLAAREVGRMEVEIAAQYAAGAARRAMAA